MLVHNEVSVNPRWVEQVRNIAGFYCSRGRPGSAVFFVGGKRRFSCSLLRVLWKDSELDFVYTNVLAAFCYVRCLVRASSLYELIGERAHFGW